MSNFETILIYTTRKIALLRNWILLKVFGVIKGTVYWQQLIARKSSNSEVLDQTDECSNFYYRDIARTTTDTRCLPLVGNTCITVLRIKWMVTTYYILLLLIEAENKNDRH